MRICICDDEHAVHDTLECLLRQSALTDDALCVEHRYSGESLLRAYSEGTRYDLIFLDVRMRTVSGMRAAREIRALDEDVLLVFVSAYEQYVFDAFPVGAMHYLLKPVQQEDFDEVFARAVRKFRERHARLELRFHKEFYSVPVDRILYAEGKNRHVLFHTGDVVYETVGKVSDYCDVLLSSGFVQAHQSFLVNMAAIRMLRSDSIVVSNGDVIWISERKRPQVRKAFDRYLAQRKW